jgi:tetratricopeptide (TPR) repeat protein
VLGTAATARLVTGDAALAADHSGRALELDAGALIALRVRALLQLASGVVLEALAVLREVAERTDNPALAIDAGGFVAQALEATGQHRAAETLAARLRADADALGLVFARRWALYVSGTVALARDPVAARGWFDAGAATVPPGCQHNVARFLVRGQGVAALLAGRLDEGAAHLLDALAQDEAVGDVHQQAITLTAIALLLAERGSYETAAELAAAADRARTAAPLDVLEWVVTARVATRIAASLPADRRTAARARGETIDLRAARALAASMT